MSRHTNWIRRAATPGACLLLLAAAAGEQPQFEVASVKPAPPPQGQTFSWGTRYDKALYTANSVPLRNLLLTAFGVKEYQLRTPSWMESERYNIQAKVPEGATRQQVNQMLLNLLIERFRIEYRKETRDLPGYALVVAKNGPKWKEAPAETEAPPASGGLPEGVPLSMEEFRRRMQKDKDGFPIPQKGGISSSYANGVTKVAAEAQPIANLVAFLSRNLGAEILDQTGLAGRYSFRMEYAGEGVAVQQLRRTGPQPAASEASDPGGPTLFSALQDQLGLRLVSTKVPMDVIVVEKAEKTPIEN